LFLPQNRAVSRREQRENIMNNDDAGRSKQAASAVAGTAREQAQEVGGTARDQAQQVANVARDKTGEVVDEAKQHARNVVDVVRVEARRRADEQTGRAVNALHDVSRQLRSMSEHGEGGSLTDLAQQAAQRTDEFASHLEQGGVDRVIQDVRSYAQRRPGTFLLAAGAAGFLVGRLVRSASSAAGSNPSPSTSTLAPTWSAQSGPPTAAISMEPTPAPPYAAGTDEPYLGAGTATAESYTERVR
jgi:hypothetical protein